MWTGLERNDNFLGNRTEQSDSLCVQAGMCEERRGGDEKKRGRRCNIGKQSFNGAKNNGNGKKKGAEGWENRVPFAERKADVAYIYNFCCGKTCLTLDGEKR